MTDKDCRYKNSCGLDSCYECDEFKPIIKHNKNDKNCQCDKCIFDRVNGWSEK